MKIIFIIKRWTTYFQQKLEELYQIELAISQESVVIKYLCRDHQVWATKKWLLLLMSILFFISARFLFLFAVISWMVYVVVFNFRTTVTVTLSVLCLRPWPQNNFSLLFFKSFLCILKNPALIWIQSAYLPIPTAASLFWRFEVIIKQLEKTIVKSYCFFLSCLFGWCILHLNCTNWCQKHFQISVDFLLHSSKL